MEKEMKVMRIEIPVGSNKQITFLYNKALDVMNKNKSAGSFTNDKIVIERVNRIGVKELKDAGVKFFVG